MRKRNEKCRLQHVVHRIGNHEQRSPKPRTATVLDSWPKEGVFTEGLLGRQIRPAGSSLQIRQVMLGCSLPKVGEDQSPGFITGPKCHQVSESVEDAKELEEIDPQATFTVNRKPLFALHPVEGMQVKSQHPLNQVRQNHTSCCSVKNLLCITGDDASNASVGSKARINVMSHCSCVTQCQSAAQCNSKQCRHGHA